MRVRTPNVLKVDTVTYLVSNTTIQRGNMKCFTTKASRLMFRATYTSNCFEGRCGSSFLKVPHTSSYCWSSDTGRSMCIVNCNTLTVAAVTYDSWR